MRPWPGEDGTSGNSPATDSQEGLTSDKMYWTDTGPDKIQRADLDGGNVEDVVTLAGRSGPAGIALDLSAPRGVPALGGWRAVLLCKALVGTAALLRRGRRLPAS